MRELTFKGYLERYLKYLGDTKTLRMGVLVTEVLPESPRIAEPMFLYFMMMGRAKRLITVMEREIPNQYTPLGNNPAKRFSREFRALLDSFKTFSELEEGLIGKDKKIPIGYQKVYDSNLVTKNWKLTEKGFLKSFSKKLRELQAGAGVSVYRICKDLELNQGNVYAYINQSDPKTVSVQTARRIESYLNDLVLKKT
jgi:hypothetical protein